MEEPHNLTIAFIMVSKPSAFDLLTDRLYYDLISLLEKRNSCRLLTIRKGHVSHQSEDNMLLKAYQGESLIFYIGTPLGFYQSEFSEDEKLEIMEKAPHLSYLLFKNENFLKRFTCFFNGRALVYQIPWSLHIYEDSLKKELPNLLSAVIEAKALNISFGTFMLPARKCTFHYKSKASHVNPVYRPRKSPYPMISVNEAVKIVLQETIPLDKEAKCLKECLSSVVAEDVLAPEPYPPFNASVKDGYAVIANDPAFLTDGSSILRVISAVTPGFEPNFTVIPGTCARVSTGGVIPPGADAVVQVEDTCVHSSEEGEESSIEILKKPVCLQDIRTVGFDTAEGSLLIPAGKNITPAEIGIMSTFGIRHVHVFKKPWVALLSTGDEVIEPENPILPGCIRDSNKSTLTHMLTENCIPLIDVGIAKDDPDSVKSLLMLALDSTDIIISTGGVSMGEKDILKQVLEKDFNATVHFGRVHVKPGKPTTFSTVYFNGEKKLIFSLPGNPVSACVCFYLFVIPCIRKMMGYDTPEHKIIKVKLGYDLKLDERPEFCRASLSCGVDGVFVTQLTGSQQSSRLLSMQNAEVLMALPPRTTELPILKTGTFVDAIVLKSL